MRSTQRNAMAFAALVSEGNPERQERESDGSWLEPGLVSGRRGEESG